MDKRHQRRILFLQALYANEFPPQSWEVEDFNFGEKTLSKVEAIKPFLAEYDAQIQAVAPERPIKDISKIDLNILRLILFEHQTKKTPVKVLIDEGVELAKEFGNDNAFAFVNAVLEKLLITNAPQEELEPPEPIPSLKSASTPTTLKAANLSPALDSPSPIPALEPAQPTPVLESPEPTSTLDAPIPANLLPEEVQKTSTTTKQP